VLNSQLTGSVQLQYDKISLLNEQVSSYKSQITSLEKKSGTNWTAFIIGIIIAIVIGYLLTKH